MKSDEIKAAGMWSLFDFHTLSRWMAGDDPQANLEPELPPAPGDDLLTFPNRPTTTAIVCAYNEAATLAGVLDALLACPSVDEIVVVEDGSSDSTPEIVARYAANRQVQALILPENHGKGYGMAQAARLAHGELLLYVDADLLNLEPAFIDALLQPVLQQGAGMVIGYPIRAEDRLDALDPLGVMRWISGERVVWRADILPVLDTLAGSRFGVETLLNLYYRQQRKPVVVIPLRGLIHPVKLEKEALPAAIRSYLKEGAEIGTAVARHPSFWPNFSPQDRARHRQSWNRFIRRRQAAGRSWLLQVLAQARLAIGRWEESLQKAAGV